MRCAVARSRHVFGQRAGRCHSSEPSQQSHRPSFTREAKTCVDLCGRFAHVYSVSGHAPVVASSLPDGSKAV